MADSFIIQNFQAMFSFKIGFQVIYSVIHKISPEKNNSRRFEQNNEFVILIFDSQGKKVVI